MTTTPKFVNYYKVFGVTPDASADDIRRSYFKLAKRYHPDAGGSDFHMRLVNEAYDALQGSARVDYDRRYRQHYDSLDQIPTADYMANTYSSAASNHQARKGNALYKYAKFAFILVVAIFVVFFGASLASAVNRGNGSTPISINEDKAVNTPLPEIKVPTYNPESSANTSQTTQATPATDPLNIDPTANATTAAPQTNTTRCQSTWYRLNQKHRYDC